MMEISRSGWISTVLRSHQRIPSLQIAKAGEVPIGGQQLPYSMMNAQGRDSPIVHARSSNLRPSHDSRQHIPVAFRLSEHHQRRRLEPRCDLFKRLGKWSRRREDPLVRDDRQKLVQAGPRKGPRSSTLCQFTQTGGSLLMPLAVAAMSIDKDVCIDSDQPPRPS